MRLIERMYKGELRLMLFVLYVVFVSGIIVHGAYQECEAYTTFDIFASFFVTSNDNNNI